MITTVLFDVDGVLLDSIDSNYAFFTHIFNRIGYDFVSREEYAPLMHMNIYAMLKHITKVTDEKELQRLYEESTDFSSIPSTAHLMRIPDGLTETIEALAKTYTLGIVTSRENGTFFTIPELQNLKHHFSVVSTYQDTTKHKPHPEPLHFALDKIGKIAQESVYIGDMPTDMQAAHAAGMKAISFGPEPLEKAHAHVHTLVSLPETIATLAKA